MDKKRKAQRLFFIFVPIIAFLFEKVLDMETSSFYIVSMIIWLYCALRCNIFAMKIYDEIRKKYNYYPKYWVQGPKRVSTFSKTQEYLKTQNDIELINKMNTIAYMERTMIYMIIETIGLIIIDII